MYPTLTLQEKLKDLRIAKGLTTEQLANATGISKSALNNYENNEFKDISHVSLVKLATFYGVSTDYLLGLHSNVTNMNTELAELHLDDKAVETLKNKNFNHRLLCELITHPEFSNLMADIELYVDQLATMQIKNMNIWVDTARDEIIEKYHPTEDDATLHTLKSAHIIEETYFTHLIHADIDTIVAELRDKHSKDVTNAPEQPVTADIKKQLKKVAEFEGSELEKLIMIFCQQTHLNYSRLTEEEKTWLIKIANKSTLLRKGSSQRGKGKKCQ